MKLLLFYFTPSSIFVNDFLYYEANSATFNKSSKNGARLQYIYSIIRKKEKNR